MGVDIYGFDVYGLGNILKTTINTSTFTPTYQIPPKSASLYILGIQLQGFQLSPVLFGLSPFDAQLSTSRSTSLRHCLLLPPIAGALLDKFLGPPRNLWRPGATPVYANFEHRNIDRKSYLSTNDLSISSSLSN